MSVKNLFKFIVSVAVCELAGILGTLFTAPAVTSWYAVLSKPALNPPAWVFAPVWTVLYFLMGMALYLVWKNNFQVKRKLLQPGKQAWNQWSEKFWVGKLQTANILAIFGLQLGLNILWSYLFFGRHAVGLAFFELLALWWAIVYTIINFYRVSKPAALFLTPYLVWVSFAVYLNFAFWILNF